MVVYGAISEGKGEGLLKIIEYWFDMVSNGTAIKPNLLQLTITFPRNLPEEVGQMLVTTGVALEDVTRRASTLGSFKFLMDRLRTWPKN